MSDSRGQYIVITNMADLHCGDHVSWPTKSMRGMASHRAIVLAWKGDNVVKVIHVTEREESSGYEVVEEVLDLEQFVTSNKLRRYKYSPDKCLEPLEVVDRARSKIGKFDYSMWNNNCENFARWCKHDNDESFQASSAKLGAAAAGSSASAVGAAALLGTVLRR